MVALMTPLRVLVANVRRRWKEMVAKDVYGETLIRRIKETWG